MRRRHRIVLLAAAAPLALAACSNGGSSAKTALDLGPTPTLEVTASPTATHTAAPAKKTPPPSVRATRTTSIAPTHTATVRAAHTATPVPAKTSPHATHTSPATRPATTLVIKAVDYRFSPANPSVNVGTTVKVVDDGSASHTWTSGTAPVHRGPFDSGNLDPGQSYTYTFNSAGTYNFFCQYHYSTGMKGRITVQ